MKQDLARIDDAIADGSFFDNPALRDACGRARESRRGRMHAIALVSDGGVHSGWAHIEAVIELAAEEGVSDLVLHVLTDGRDTLPRSGAGYVAEVERWLVHAGRVGTVGGRYWGMDRDKRWERTKKAYDAIVLAEGEHAASAGEAIAAAYAADVTDEFIEPTVIGDYDGVAPDEPVLFVNFRPDRARQMTLALGDPAFDDFDRGRGPVLEVTTMTEYRDGWDVPGRLSPFRAGYDPRRGDRRARGAPAARRRDREVRARHLLLQRRPRAGVERGGARPRPVAPRRPDLRPQARDERRGSREAVHRELARGACPSSSASSTSRTRTWSATPA